MTLCLNMIVRDEAAVIERCLASVRPFIDHWLIVDTGSTDDTPARVRAALDGIPGTLARRPWRNFGHNRNEALELARGCADYLLFIDADETLSVASGTQRPRLDSSAYSLEARYGSMRYDRVGLVSTALPWRWQGVVHEFLDAGQPVAQPRLPGWAIEVRSEGARSRDPDKYLKDAALLEAALRDDPNDPRHVFYLAQSYRDAGRLEEALAQYERRVTLGGWEEEAWYAGWQCAVLMERLGYAHGQIVAAYLSTWERRPSRAEPLVELARYFRQREEWHNAELFAGKAAAISMPVDRLFVDVATYTWRARDELALTAFYTGRVSEARQLWQALLDGGELPPGERLRIVANLGFAAKPRTNE